MPNRYVTPFTLSTTPTGSLFFLTAGTQGLTLTAAVFSNSAPAGTATTLSIDRATLVAGGTPATITSLDDPAPTALATAVSAPASATLVGSLGNFYLTGPATSVDFLAESGPIAVAPGNGIRIQLGTGTGGYLRLYFEE